MGRGRSSGGSRGSNSFGGGSRGMSRSSVRSNRSGRSWGGHHHTTVFIGGHRHYHGGGGSSIVGIVVGAIFVLVGLFVMFSGLSSCASTNKYATVDAECIKNEYVSGWYYTTYEYSVDGVDYTNRSNEGWELPETVGKVVTIYYLKSDPNEITEENPNDNGEGGVVVFAGLICAGLGALPLVLCIKELKKKKENSANPENDSSTIQPTIKEETHNKCPYCGSKYKKTSDSCPKCGASRID